MKSPLKFLVLPFALVLAVNFLPAAENSAPWRIVSRDDGAEITAGSLTRQIHAGGRNLATTSLRVAGQELLVGTFPEILFTVRRAAPNRRPIGLKPGEGALVQSEQTFTYYGGKPLDPARWEDRRSEATHWTNAVTVTSDRWAAWAGQSQMKIVEPKTGVRRIVIRTPLADEAAFGHLIVNVCYEIYAGHSAVRKWIEIENTGDRWLLLDYLMIDPFSLAEAYRHATPMTPRELGASSCVVGFGNAAQSCGVIAATEVPSALRSMRDDGAMGYSEEWFEWVLGPRETFVSEPVFLYAYAGPVEKTLSASSTPRDRTIEGPYLQFVHQHVSIAADSAPLYAPQWLTLATFKFNIDDALMHTQADLAARAGFAQILFDDGWQKDRLGTQVDIVKFPDFAATAQHIRSRGLSLGLWVSCVRSDDSPDLRVVPDGRSLPPVKRMKGTAMSFSSPWRKYYAEDLVRVAREFGVTYFKQDFSNVRYGDIAAGHEGRTLQDSLLRGLRNLLETQNKIRAAALHVVTELTHEIYWDTPGVPADLAVLEHACQYHFPFNACWGADHWPDPLRKGISRKEQIDPATHRAVLRQACFEARKRFYAHRDLPLHCLEFYAAATQSVQDSLTPDVQDRQIVSWLMGASLNFSGDLRTLSAANIAHYRRRFDLLKRLQERYDIYRHFQFSGVPALTDVDWHWWGKLNQQGNGAVVVLRGSEGAGERAVNIPWVLEDRIHRVHAQFNDKPLGKFTGRELQEGKLRLALPTFGQEILEVKAEP